MEKSARLYPTNPLGIIATFVFFIEAITASSLHFLKGNPLLLEKIVNFIILFPTGIAIAFFLILYFKRENLFAPSDFQNQEHFLLLIDRLHSIEFEQKVTQAVVSPPNDLELSLSLVDGLLVKKEFRNVIKIGRGYIKIEDYIKAKKFFEYVKSKMPQGEELYYKVLTNIAYAQIGLGEYNEALKNLQEVERLVGDKIEVWHLASLAYTLFKLTKEGEYQAMSARCIQHSKYQEHKERLKLHYKDMPAFSA